MKKKNVLEISCANSLEKKKKKGKRKEKTESERRKLLRIRHVKMGSDDRKTNDII